MPIGEDDCDLDYSSGQSGMSKAEQRKSNKPIMEKRRRARINHCLNELKSLILEAMKKDPARHSKLEKADILEMTVKHLHTIQRQQLNNAIVVDPQVLQKFKTGFSECAGEVSRYISRLDGVEPAVRHRLVAHLSNCVSGLQVAPVSVNLGNGVGVTQVVHTTPMMPQVTTPNSGDINNNSNVNNRVQVPAGLQLIPSRLPSGELALVLPNGQLPAGVLPFIAQPESIVSPMATNHANPIPPPAPPAPCAPPVANRTIDRSKGSAFTAVGRSASPECLSSSSLEEEESTTTTDTFTSPDTPPTSARALHQTRVAAEVKKELVYPPSPASSSSETRSLAELKLEVRAVDFSLKRERPSGSDDAVPPPKVPRIAVPQPQQPLPRAHSSSRQPSMESHSSEEARENMWRPW